MQVLWPNFAKRDGLVVVVVRDAITHEILMVAYANEAAFRLTLETAYAWFFSTSRNKLWMKGEESGNKMLVTDVLVDCDGDAVAYDVVQKGSSVACHTGARTCFYRGVFRNIGVPAPKAGPDEELQKTDVELHPSFLPLVSLGPPSGGSYVVWSISQLERRLRERAKAPATESYTRKLLDKGTKQIAKKFGEEAVELALASVCETKKRVVSEAADAIYHMLVLLQSRGLHFGMVEEELKRREQQSGLAEKAARK